VNACFFSALVAGLIGLLGSNAGADVPRHVWLVPSPTHGQTYTFGSEQHQQWLTRGADRHLALSTEFTNDPYVDLVETRQYDYFIFDFPNIRLGSDGHTFYYRTPGGKSVAVAVRHPGLFGLQEVTLLQNSVLVMKKPHGYLSLELVVANRAFPQDDDSQV
jgi:hypothetical protein